MLRLTPQDVFVGSPPLAFTFGLGGLAIFPLRFGATATLLENASPANMIGIIETYKATIGFTSPTAYRAMIAAMDEGADLSSLRMAISAGETLPAPVFEDGRGKPASPSSTASAPPNCCTSSSAIASRTARPVRPAGVYRVRGPHRRRRHEGSAGRHRRPPGGARTDRLPVSCGRSSNDVTVRDGFNMTGDDFFRDSNGVFHFVARADDMIISSGYNIAGPEVEAALLVARGRRGVRRHRRARSPIAARSCRRTSS